MGRKYHFIAIGGVGMSGLAKYLLQQGYEVSGSDISESKYTNLLKDLGGKIFIGHSPDNLPEDSIVVVSSAIKKDNPELIKAQKLGLPVYHRSDMLAEISKSDKCFLGFSGTHGKTTTSGMTSYLLSKAGLNPSFVVGGILPEYNTNAEYCASGKYFAAELDESDGTIVKYSPDVVVVNNLEADHLDYYKNGLDDVLNTFETFLGNLKPSSKVLVNIDNLGVSRLKNIEKYITYGLNSADYTAKNIQYCYGYTTFDFYYKEDKLESVKIILPGEHNVYNTLAVLSALHQSSVDIGQVVPHLETFTGMGRRFQKVAEIDGITVFDDYAHHPTEIKSTLSALKSFTDKPVVVVFQPHRYTRLKSLWNDFVKVLNEQALGEKFRLIITDVYSASENEIEGINSEIFSKEVKGAEYVPGTINDVAQAILRDIKDDSVVIGLGAGTITNLAKEILKIKEGK